MSARTHIVTALLFTAFASVPALPAGAQQARISAAEVESILYQQNVDLLRSMQRSRENKVLQETLPNSAIQRSIEESQRAHSRNLRLSHRLVGTGAVLALASLVSYVNANEMSMNTRENLFLIGGMGLTTWGAERHHAASRALDRSRHLQQQAQAQ